MIATDKRLRLCKALLVCNLIFIWGNSLLPGAVSGALSDWVKGLLETLIPGEGIEGAGGGLLRKAAHFTEFLLLGVLLSWLLGMLRRHPLGALAWGAAAACTDEVIQCFVPDRGPSLKDVAIDCCGVLTGIILLRAGYTYWKRKPFQKHLEDNK